MPREPYSTPQGVTQRYLSGDPGEEMHGYVDLFPHQRRQQTSIDTEQSRTRLEKVFRVRLHHSLAICIP